MFVVIENNDNDFGKEIQFTQVQNRLIVPINNHSIHSFHSTHSTSLSRMNSVNTHENVSCIPSKNVKFSDCPLERRHGKKSRKNV